MRAIPCAVLLVLLLTATLAVAAPVPAEQSFPLGVYWPWERACGNAQRLGIEKWAYVDQRLDDMKAHNVDTLWVVNLGIGDLGPLAERVAARQMRLIPALGELHYNIAWRRNNWEYLEKESRRALAAAGHNPAVLAWALCDEPRKDLAAEMETFRQKFASWGATQPAITVTMWPDTPTYARDTGFPVPCTDVYPFFSTGNPNGPNPAAVSRGWYRRQVQTTVQAAAEKGRPAWIMPQMFADIWGPWKYDAQHYMTILPGGVLHWRAPTVGETRWQIWSALGLGARGVVFYVHEPPVGDNASEKPYTGTTFPATLVAKEASAEQMPGGLIRRDGSATPQYEAMAAAFAQARPLQQALLAARPVDLWPVQVSAPGWVGVLQADKQGEAPARTLLVVVNDDTDRPQDLRLTGEYKSLRDLRTGKPVPLRDGAATVRLEAGDGTVLEAR